jgi:pimeloyl-ACP methyl ester carboxylesterase
MTHLHPDLQAPRLSMLALEFLRAPFEFGAVLPAWPLLQRAPRGDGHMVVVFPGLAAGDPSTLPLRGYLTSLGYATEGWSQGFNFGPRAGILHRARQHVLDLHAETGRKVSLIGWSLGGIYARELAKELPEAVRCVVTLGTPFSGPPKSTNAWRLYELTSGHRPDDDHGALDLPTAPPVPTTSIFSRTDGVVAWQGSVQDPGRGHAQAENIEVVASHLGLGVHPSAWWAVADRLAQPEGAWRAFDRTGLFGIKTLLYPDPSRR